MLFLKSFSGDAEIIRWMNEPQNLVHFAHELSFERFQIEMLGSRFPYLLKGGGTGSEIWFPVRGGDYYLSFQFLATESNKKIRRRFEVQLDGQPLGQFELDAFDGRYYLFCSEHPIPFMGHRRVQLKVLEGEDIALSCAVFSKTPVFPACNAVKNLTAMDGKIRFTTTQPSICRLECGDVTLEEKEYYCCHTFDVEAIAGKSFVICAKEEGGREVHKEGVVIASEAVTVHNDMEYRQELFYEKRSQEKVPVMAFFGFGQGECYELKEAGICDDFNKAFPADCIVTSHWNDGSIKSVAITAVIVPDGRRYYFTSRVRLEDENRFDVFQQDELLQVINGRETINFVENPEYLLPNICSKTVLYINSIRLEAMVDSWHVKKKGEAVIVLERKGRFPVPANEQKLNIELTFYRGIPGYRLSIGLENSQLNPRLFSLDSWYLEFSDIEGAENRCICQIDDKWADVDGALVESRYDGDMNLGQYCVHVADFWQNYPKSIQSAGQEASIGLLPFIIHQEIYDEYTPEERRKLLYFMEDGRYRMHVGMRKLIQIGFSNTVTSAEMLTEPIFMRPESSSLEKSGAFGPILCCCQETQQFDKAIERGYELLVRLREEKREYGMFNYGDWHGERNVNWGNCEYDLPYAGLIQYLRGAGEKYARMGILAAEHMEQVDHIRVHAIKEMIGLFFLHTPGHSNYYEGNNDEVWNEYFVHVGHLFVQGLTEWYKITGNQRYKDAILRCADNLCGDYCTCFDFVTEREPAWVMLLMLAVYELTLDQKYINACRVIVERIAYKQDEKTGAIKAMVSFAESERKIVFGGKPFMCGILMSALQRYHRCVEDEISIKVMEGIAHWLVYDMWDEEANGFWYTTYAKTRGTHCYPANNMEIIEGLLFVYEKNGDPLLYDRAMKAFECAMNLEYREFDVGKTFAMRLRFSPEILRMLYKKK